MPIGYAKAADALRGGDRLMIANPDPSRQGERIRYALLSSGKTILPASYRKLAPNLAPEPDGLLGAETAQTFRWRDDT